MVRLLQRLSAFLLCKLANKASNGLHLVLSPAEISDEYRTFVSLSQNFKSQIHSVVPTAMLGPESQSFKDVVQTATYYLSWWLQAPGRKQQVL